MSRHGGVLPRARSSRRLGVAALSAALVFVAQVASGVSVGFTGPISAQAAQGHSGHPNRFDPRASAKSVNHLPAPPATPGPKPTYSPPRVPAVPMQAALVPLDPVAGAHFVGSDGVLELSVPAGAVTAADVKAAGGSMSLLVRQVMPASGSNAGGWGKYSFGTWLVQVVDAGGRPASQGLRKSPVVKLHQDQRASALNLAHVRVQVNPPLPSWVDLNPASAPVKPTTPVSGSRQVAPASGNGGSSPSTRPALGPTSRQTAALDGSTSTLSAAVAMSGPNTAVSFDTDAPVATFGRPDPFETNLSAGALSAGIKLDLPAGPGGLTPPLTLAYSSSAVNDQHNPQGAAPWVGEGWSLGLGAISWAEHNVFTVNPASTPMWEDSWQLSDPYGTAADLVPPNVNVSTYNDDSGNPITPSPITWHTAPETRAKVISFQSPSYPYGISPAPPCFRAFLPTGIMEEFGCTIDSLQFYRQTTGTTAGQIFLANWLLDLITDPQGNQIHVTYQQDMAVGYNGQGYPRDVVAATVEWDSPGCRNAQTACTGAAWAPLMRVNFAAGHGVAHVAGATCAANGSLRCDDPVDLSGTGGVAAPLVQSTFVLNDARVQVRSSGSGSWNTLRDYQFGYDQSGPSTITDPVSGAQQSVAGRLLLTRLQVIGADGATSLPARTFGYTTVTEWYEDSLGAPKPSGNCGPAWNNGNTPNGHTGCVLWSQSYAGNSSYLSSVSNGLGLSESFSWQLARNNFHGVVSGSNADPFACNNGSVQSTFPCNMPDDGTWSRAVLVQRQDSVTRLTQTGQGGAQTSTPVTSTWNYSYQVPYPLVGLECNLCVATFYWGNQNDFDLLDFYNAKFMAFAQTNVGLPDGSVQVHKFHSTEGFGIYDTSRPELVCNTTAPCHNDPYSDIDNAAHGHEYELDRYATDGTTLLQQVKTRWAAACPPPGVSGTPYTSTWGNWDGNLVTELDHSNPVMVCEVHPVRVDRYTYDGTGGQPVHAATAYSYDAYGRVASQAQVANTGSTSVADASGHGNAAALNGGVTEQMPGLVGDGGTGMSFDGSSGYISAPALTPMQGDNTRSVEVWFSTTSTSQQVILDGGGLYANGQSFILGLTHWGGVNGAPGNTPGLYLAMWSDDVYLPNLNLTDGQPHQVVVTLSGSSLTMYVDGATPSGAINGGTGWGGLLGQPFALPIVPNTASNPLWLGRGRAALASVGSAYFNGTLDEAAVYDHVLTSARVSAHRTAGSGYSAAVLADSPTAYYGLDDGSGGPGPNTIVSKPQYAQNDGVSATSTSATGSYLIDYPAFDDLEDTGGNRYQCSFSSYDGQAFTTGQTAGLTLGEVTTQDHYTGCGTSPSFTPSGQIRTTNAFDLFGNRVASSDADANAGNGAHLGCAVGSTSYSSCTTYDGTFGALPVSAANALNQVTTSRYTSGATAPPTIGPIASGISGKCVDDAGNGSADGTHVQLWDCNGTPGQNWTIMPNGTIKINGKCLDVTGNATNNGAPVEIWSCVGTPNQLWQVSNGALVNPQSGRCLDDPGASTTNGTQLDIWDCVGAANEMWTPPGGPIVDSSGQGNHASWSGGVTFGTAGLVSGGADSAMGFSGGYLQLPAAPFGSYPASGSTTSYSLSVEAWFQTTSGGVILGQMAGGPPPNALSGFVPAIYVDTTGALRESLFWHGQNVAAGPYNDGHPHHVVATYANGTDSLYVDGTLAASSSQAEAGYASTYTYLVGDGYTASWANTNGSWYPFNGSLGQVAVYGSALSAARVQAHFTAGSGYSAAVLADSPTGYYRLNDPGPLVADSSGRANHGAWNGTQYGSASGLVSGFGDPAMGFDGSEFAKLPTNVFGSYPTSGSTNSYSLSFEAWFQTTSGGVILGQVAGALPPNYPSGGWVPAIYVDTTGALRESLFWHNYGQNVASGQYNDGRPHQVVATYSNGTDSLYVDGQLKASSAQSEYGYASSYSYLVGTGYTTSGWTNTPSGWYGFSGAIGQASVYGSALSAARVQAHFTAGSGYQAAVLADSPTAYYRLNNATPSGAGYGLWPISTTDANGQTTSVTYDGLGRQTSETRPGETGGLTTKNTSYTVWCPGTGAQSPCVEVDKTQRLNATTTATHRAFYDGLGHLVETRSPAPGGQDVVRYSFYDPSRRRVFQSVPYLVTAYTGGPGSAAYSIPDSTVAGTTSGYDGLGRLTSSTDALSFQSRKSYAVVCNPAGTGDAGCYEQTLSIDAKGHQGGTLVDGMGRTAYVQRYTGSSSSNYALYATARYTYDYAGDLTRIVQPDGSTQTTFGYDMAGRKTAMSDPDLGAQTYTYDQDGNLVQSVDARGGAGTIFVGYDGLNRPIWRNTSNSPTGAYDTYSYDSTAGGNVGVGRLTGEAFATGSLSGSYAYTYDGRGQQTASMLTVGSSSYPLGSTYDDAGNVLTQTYPDGETITNSYTAQGWLSGVSTTKSGVTTTLASNLAYSGTGGAFGEITGMHLGGGYDYSASYDLLDRATDLKTKRSSDSAVLFDQSRAFDAAGNVTSASTTMPSGTDNQSFCYDEHDRLTWASSATATPPCGGSNTAGTLTAAQYTQTFSYDVLGRLTSGPLGSYAYGSSAHVHAATGIGTGWTAAYDAAGSMTCRAPSQSSTCAGTQTGAQLSYNNEGELQSWQNTPTSPSTTAQFLYDGQGQRVQQVVTQAGITTSTVYVRGTEEVSTSGSTTTTTSYYYAGGKRIGLSVNGVVSYLASDGLGSATVALSGSGSATASQLFAPYGGVRYSSGSMPTTYSFTGQRADAATGLLYYGARYYDGLAGQFTSGDSLLSGSGFDLWGLSRYAYVEGNPIGRTDPTGHCSVDCSENDPTDPSMNPPASDPCADGACDPPPCDTCLDPGYDMGTPPPPPPDPCDSCIDPGYDQGSPTSSPAAPDVKRDDSSGDVSQARKSSLPGWLQTTGDVIDSVFGISATDAAIDRVSRGEGTPDDYLQIMLMGGSVHDDPFANSTKEDIARIAENLTFGQHASQTMATRGWTEALVKQTVANPKRIVKSLRDTRYNPVTQTRNNFPATAYVDSDGNYVVVRNIDGDVVQVNDRADPNWQSPF